MSTKLMYSFYYTLTQSFPNHGLAKYRLESKVHAEHDVFHKVSLAVNHVLFIIISISSSCVWSRHTNENKKCKGVMCFVIRLLLFLRRLLFIFLSIWYKRIDLMGNLLPIYVCCICAIESHTHMCCKFVVTNVAWCLLISRIQFLPIQYHGCGSFFCGSNACNHILIKKTTKHK